MILEGKFKFKFRCDKLFLEDEFVNKVYAFTLPYLKNDNLQIIQEAIKLLVKILREGPKYIKDEILKYTETEILGSKNYFVKRKYLNFFEECLEVFSFTFIKEKRIFENIVKLLSANQILLLNKFLKLIPKFYHLIVSDSKLKSFVTSKIDNCRKFLINDLYTVENVSNIDNWLENFTKNYDPEENIRLLKLDKIKFDKETKMNFKDLNVRIYNN
jgi:hypothetical protein